MQTGDNRLVQVGRFHFARLARTGCSRIEWKHGDFARADYADRQQSFWYSSADFVSRGLYVTVIADPAYPFSSRPRLLPNAGLLQTRRASEGGARGVFVNARER